MRRLLILASLSFAVFLMVGLAAFMPYHFYYVALESGLDSRFLKLPRPRPALLAGQMVTFEGPNDSSNEAARWRELHLGDYMVPMPVRHPYYLLIPDIDIDREQKPQIAWELQNQNLRAEIRIDLLSPLNYEYPFAENLLFRLPIFQNYLLTVSSDQIWSDLFLLNLQLPASDQRPFLAWVESLWEIPYTQLAYRLFILKTRQALFPEDVRAISFHSKKKMGLLELEPKPAQGLVSDNTKREQIMLLQEGQVHRMTLTSMRYSEIAQNYRLRLLHQLSWLASNPDMTVGIYNEFSKLPYERRIDQEGMTYLFAGWTHVPKQEEFLRTMIQFLERGKKNFPHLSSLYQYAYKVFGTSFSKEQENLMETEQRKLERKISEEFNSEMNQVESTQVIAPDGNFANEKDQVDYFLQQAKEHGSSNGDGMLVE